MRNAMLTVLVLGGFAGPAAAQDGVPGKTKAQAEAAKAAALAVAETAITESWVVTPLWAAARDGADTARKRYKNSMLAWTDPADAAMIGLLLDSADALGVDATGWLNSADATMLVAGSYLNAGEYWLGVGDWDTACSAFTFAAETLDYARGAYDACADAAFSQAWATGAAWTIMNVYQPWWE